ncbi:MAG: hypothetical protein AB4040_19655 [Synechococcus sp.]
MSNRDQQSVVTPKNSSSPAERETADRIAPNSFQEGYWQGRDRAARDYAHLAAQPAVRNNPTILPGILLGMLMASVIGGGIVASFYFDSRLNTIVDETETLNETLQGENAKTEGGERPEGGDENSSNRFNSGDAPPTDRFDPSSLEEPANPSPRPPESAMPPTNAVAEPEASEVEIERPSLDSESAPEVSE